METAQYYALALKLRVISGELVQRWVMKQAESSEYLEGPLLELTFLSSEDVNEMIDLLNSFTQPDELYSVLRKVLRDIPESVITDKTRCRELARHLYQLYVESDYSVPDDFDLIGWFDDEYDLAAQGILLKNTDDWHASFVEFIRTFNPNNN